MSTAAQPAITDAKPAQQAANPSPADLALGAAARAFASAADAVERHPGARAGEAYQALLDRWRETYADLRRIAGAHPGE